MSTSPIRGLTTIIVPCWNEIAFTQQCIASLKSHTRPPWELIVIDNGSTDPTPTYLAGVHDMAAVPVTIVTNTRNLGFPAAINQGLRLARGEFRVLLNNDVVVTNGWLDQLIALVNARRDLTTEGTESTERMAEKSGEEKVAGEPSSVSRNDRTAEAPWPTPPAGPPLHKGEKVLVLPRVDGAAGVPTPVTSVGTVPGSAVPTPVTSVGAMPGSAESAPVPSVAIVPGSAEPTPLPSVGIVPGSAESIPPDPLSRMGGGTLGFSSRATK